MEFLTHKKSLDKLSLGDLHIMKAEIEYIREQNVAHLKEVDNQIYQTLHQSQSSISEHELRIAAEKLTIFIETKREYIAALHHQEKKLTALEKLIRAKETQQIFPKKHRDILDVLDIDKFLVEQDDQKIKTELQQIQIERIIASDNTTDHTDALKILKSVYFDGEDITIAKTELDELI